MRTHSIIVSLCLVLGGCTTLGKMGQVIMDPSIAVGGLGDQPTQVALSLYASPTLNGNPRSVEPAVAAHASEMPPAPYAVSLTAADPHALTGKLLGLLAHLQSEFPAMSPVPPDPQDTLEQSPAVLDSLGHYEAAGVHLAMPGTPPATATRIATPIAVKVLQLRDDSLLLNATFSALDEDLQKALRSTYVRDDDYLLLPGQFKFVPFEAIEPATRFIAVIASYRDRNDVTWKQALRIEPHGRKVALAVQVEDKQVLLKEES
ncbi:MULTISPECIES: type VI secretion system lipoprotein TssJ [Pseudomonas]|nr:MULTISPECIES: type VI secretion system lipoprotein TssJ [Pseudomonas]